MNRISPDFVEKFMVSFLNRAGAVVEKPGYGLTEVLLPEDLVPTLEREELLLAFDYETARENPGSIYVTPGSYMLDQAVQLAREYGRYTSQYWPGKEVIFPKNLETKISQGVTYLNTRPPQLTEVWAAENIYYGFYFLSTLRWYEKEEQIFPIVVNGFSGLPCHEFAERWQKLIPLESAEYKLDRAPILPLTELYEVACSGIQPHIQKKAHLLKESSARLADREKQKTNRYYRGVITEIEARLKSAASQAKIERLQMQLKAARGEWERREEDIASRYEIKAELRLDHLVAFFVPTLFINVELQHKRQKLHHCLIFNPLLGEIEAPKCQCCGNAAQTLAPGRNGVFSCPDCKG